MEACVCKSGFGSSVISNTENDVRVFFGAGKKRVEVFQVDICFIKHVECIREFTGCITDFNADDLGSFYKAAELFKGGGCLIVIVYDKTEDTKVLSICD